MMAACSKSSAPDPDQLKIAALGAKKLAFESYPNWASQHPEKACPAKIEDLEGGAAKDPWGHSFEMLCGPNLPPGARGGFAVLSFGPDGKEGTPDDIKSWE
jgi:hypothetical protein